MTGTPTPITRTLITGTRPPITSTPTLHAHTPTPRNGADTTGRS